MKYELFFMVSLLLITAGCADQVLNVNNVPSLKVDSSFDNNGTIPFRYTCDGTNVNPPLSIRDIPNGTKSMTLIVDDPNSPSGLWTYWVVYNIPVTKGIEEKSIPGTQAINSLGDVAYDGPCPPSGTDEYFFRVYALDTKLQLSDQATRSDVDNAMQGHVLAYGELTGLYGRTT